MGIPFNRETGPRGGSLGIPPEQFRETVRTALGRESGPPTEPYDVLTQGLPDIEEQAQAVRRRIAEERPGLMDQLAETAALRSWNVQRCDGAEEALGYVASLVRSLGVTSVARSEQPVFDTVPWTQQSRGPVGFAGLPYTMVLPVGTTCGSGWPNRAWV